jgi:hypothetical protein
VLAIALFTSAQPTVLHAAQRQQGTPSAEEPWECAECRTCKDNPKKVCGDSKSCSSYCAQLCVLCSQKSLTGTGAGSAAGGGQRQKLEAPP